MEVILKEDVKNLGEKNAVVKVKNGYGLNYLIPKGLALLATASTKKMHAENLKQKTYKEGLRKAEIEKVASNLRNLSLVIKAKIGDSGKLFGSVTNIQVSEALKNLGHEVDRRHISLHEEHIKEPGKYTATLQLHKEVKVEVPFEVVSE